MDVGHARRQQALLELARLDHRDFEDVFRATTEAASLVLDVERASIWQFSADTRSLVCEDLFLRQGRGGHLKGDVLRAKDYPRYFEALTFLRALAADRAQEDPRTADLREPYLERYGIVSMLDVPIRTEGRIVGVLCAEHIGAGRHWEPDEETFAASLADIAALAIEASARDLAEQRLREVLNAVTEAVFLVDLDGNLGPVNAAAARVIARIGTNKTAVATERFEIIDVERNVIPREHWPPSRALRGEVVTGEVIGTRHKKSGDIRFVRMHAAPLYVGGRVRNAVTVVTDVSQEVYLEYLKRDLLATLAHELKTPAAIAKGYAQYMVRDAEAQTKWRPMLEAIDRASNRIDQLVSVLLATSSIMLGHLVLTRQRFDLAAQIRQTITRLAPLSPKHEIVLSAPAAVFLQGDGPKIEQAIEQLLLNALRFSPEGGEVRVTVNVHEASVIVAVRDQGVGIPVSEYAHVFSPYRRGHSNHRKIDGGIGMGLYLCRELVRAHGGDTWFDSVEGEGTTFYIRLPNAEPPS